MQLTKKSFFSLILSFCMLFSLLSTILAKPVDAKTVRVAVITSLSGEVTVKKGGGSKTYDAYENMSLNQGDTLYTGSDSSVTLNLSNGDADVTLGDNAELNVSDLNSSNGSKKSKLKMWAGSMWVKVKSLAGSNDEFEVETPTAVMGVRGTQFFVGVAPQFGIKVVVFAGKVSATTITNNGTQTFQPIVMLPTQQFTQQSREEVQDSFVKAEFIDVKNLIKDASPAVLKAIIKDKEPMDRENDAFIARKKKELEDVIAKTGDETSLSVKNLADLDKVKQNLDNLVGNIAKEAVADSKISMPDMVKIIDEANRKIADIDRKLDLDKVKDLDKTAGLDPELEKKKQEELQRLKADKLKKKLEEEKKQEEIQKQLAAALKALEEQRAKITAAAKAAVEKAKDEAEVKLKESLSDAEKKEFDDAKNGTKTQEPVTGSDPKEPDSPSAPAPALTLASPTINEDVANDGRIKVKQVITLANGTFNADMSTGVTVNNLPAGFSTSVTRNNERQITIEFTGKAIAHAAVNDVANSTVTIAKAKIVGATGDVTSNTFKIKFRDTSVSLVATADPTKTQGFYNLDINLSDFAGDNDIYGVELHLLYGGNTFYDSAPVINGVIFSPDNSADHIKEYQGFSQKELVYAVTNFGSTTGNISVSGTKNLVKIPMHGYGSQTIKVGKIVIVRKDGSTVQNIEIPATSILPATITTGNTAS